jgi:hypothetical protein
MMKITLPDEPVYYYECSNGDFRLTYYLPIELLHQLVNTDQISADVLKDFPDGVDLDCTEPDFNEFQRHYHYRPEPAPDAIQRAFFTLLTSTKGWRNFRGSGFISARDIEQFVETVESHRETEHLRVEDIPELPIHPSLRERRERNSRVAVLESELAGYLESLPLKGIDPNLRLDQQQLSSIRMQDGENVAEAFTKLLKNQGKG